MDKDKRVTASEVLFDNVFQISEDAIQTTYSLVEHVSRIENVFRNMSKKLGSINANLSRHVLKLKWISQEGKKSCRDRVNQTSELKTTCNEYAAACLKFEEELIAITERFEANKKAKGIIANLVRKIQERKHRAKED